MDDDERENDWLRKSYFQALLTMLNRNIYVYIQDALKS